jgi:hypothetical protein
MLGIRGIGAYSDRVSPVLGFGRVNLDWRNEMTMEDGKRKNSNLENM